MDAQLNKPNYSGISVDFGGGDDCSVAVITGMDFDAVHGKALDVKNALALDVCPEVEGPFLDVSSGCWSATVRTRRSEA